MDIKLPFGKTKEAIQRNNGKLELAIPDIAPAEIFERVRRVPDFPRPGVNFVDISAITADRQLFQLAINSMKEGIKKSGFNDFAFVALDSRGFLFGAALAWDMGKDLVLARKKGKLPGETYSQTYDLEYGQETIEINKCDIREGAHYVIVDDIIATGGTIRAVEDIITSHGGIVDMSVALFLIKECRAQAEKTTLNPAIVVAEV